jgi:hypothetical protein
MLQSQLGTLQSQYDALAIAKTASDDQARTAEAGRQALLNRPLELTLAAKRFTPATGVAMVTGPAGASVKVELKRAGGQGSSARVLASATGKLNSQGARLFRLRPGRAVRRALGRKRAIRVTVSAASGDLTDSARATLTR